MNYLFPENAVIIHEFKENRCPLILSHDHVRIYLAIFEDLLGTVNKVQHF